MTAAARRPAARYQAVLLIRPEAWQTVVRWLPRSGLASTSLASPDTVPRFELTPAAGRKRDLSDREVDVLELIAEGLQNPDIAGHLKVSVDTVKTHTKSIYRKFGVHSRAHAVHIGYQRGILGGAS
ncbi:response regulator transcription factor [Amycolatopsis eburnea]|uniref:LuxR family transcriptional regulator n=1 Tax=Amycolatopsis eburnea TaxID=2267691 RepID=A0A427TGH9_9PSEU|nr:helix-turn-helix transcriptional regulator [Amycolatopsis eburnea]RSD21976.1 LuxR family transcriptional regulator [Amycolatopsis eburnea]